MQNNLILKGMGASAGIAKGKVKIIKEGEAANFNEGEILVTKITYPSMVMMMSKAAAIVTELGGLTSHPAIVSREMGIPCVVATKTGTIDLKDGMEIIVDGSKGEVYEVGADDYVNKDDNKNQDYNNLIEAYRQAYAKMDGNTFAETDFRILDPLIAESWTERLLGIICQTKRQKLSPKEIAGLMHAPNVLRSAAIFDMFMAGHAGKPLEKREEIADFYISALKALCLTDPFSLNGMNVVHDEQELKKMTGELKPADQDIAKKIGRLVNACYHMGYSLFGDMNPMLVYENYGPYKISKDGKEYLALAKEFKNLKPTEFWPESCRIPIERIKIICLYENVKFSIDAITHTNYEGDIINGLRYYSIYADDKLINIQTAEKITSILERYADFIWYVFKEMDEKRFRLTYLYQKAYLYINLCKKLGISWKPDEKIINDILNKPIKVWPEFKDQKEKDEFFFKIIDPRIDFSG